MKKYLSMRQLSVTIFSVIFISLFCVSCSESENSQRWQSLTTIADARNHPASFVDVGVKGDSVGDVLTFDQPLLDVSQAIIGNNSGSCVRIKVAVSFQCQWTLTFIDRVNANVTGTIQIAGREFDQGTSVLPIVGGTGQYAGIRGELYSTNNNDGTFTQVLKFTLK